MQKLKASIAAFLWALASNKALAAAATAGAAAATAATIGVDPWPWAIGAAGAAIVYAKQVPGTRLEALGNSLISILLGGVAAPVAASIAERHIDAALGNQYAMALLLSAAWPWLVPFAGKWLAKKGEQQ